MMARRPMLSRGRRIALSVSLVAMVAVAVFPRIGEWLASAGEIPGRVGMLCVLNGEPPARALEAARLYHEGRSALIFLPRGPVTQAAIAARCLGVAFPEEQHVNREILLRQGVPDGAIVLGRSPAVNTADEARQTARVVRSRGITSLVVVTSPYHVRRARLVFRRILPRGVTVHASGSRFSESRPERWWASHRDRRDVVLELLKLTLGSLPGGGGR